MSVSAARIRSDVCPGPPLPMVKPPLFIFISQIGEITAAVPQAKASHSRPLSESSRH